MPAGEPELGWITSSGEFRTGAWWLTAGVYLIDCKTADHVWRAAQLEVVAP